MSGLECADRHQLSRTVVQLSEVADIQLGKMLDAKRTDGKLLPYIRNPNVRWFDLDLTDLKVMPFKEHEIDKFRIQDGDILICEGGEAGRAAIWNGGDTEIKYQKAIHRVRARPSLSNRYFLHKFYYDYHTGALEDYYTGATIKHLTAQDLARYRFLLPPLEEQRRIAAILDQADTIRRQRRAALERLDVLPQACLREVFDTNEDIQEKYLEDLVEEFRYGTSEKATELGNPVLRIPNVVGGSIDCSDLKYVSLGDAEFQRLRLKNGDILFVRTNGNPSYVGRSAVVDQTLADQLERPLDQIVYASYLIRGRLKLDQINPVFVQAFLSSDVGRRALMERARTSAGQYNINTEGLAAIPIPIPPLSLQQAFAARVRGIEALKEKHRAHLAQLDTLFASLQHRAFRGEL